MQRNKNFGESMNMFEEKMKDSRRLLATDRFQQCIKNLHEFLIGLGFPGTITVKSLQTPSAADFIQVFSFAHHFSESSFQFPTNGVEGETMEMLKDLGYPVAFSNSLMRTTGSCPEFVGGFWFNSLRDWIINWLIIMMMCQTKEKESYLPWDLEERPETNELLMENCCETYRKFLEGADTVEDKDKALITKLLQQFNLDKQDFIPQQRKHRMMMGKLETAERECQDRLKREESLSQQILEKQKITAEDIRQDNREWKEHKQSLTQCLDEIIELMRKMLGSDQELGGDGAAGVERGGANTPKSRKVKKVRRKRRK